MFLADQIELNFWLNARLDAGHVISHRVHTVLFWVGILQVEVGSLASLQLLLPVNAFWSALLDEQLLRVLPVLEHLFDGI